MASDQPSRSPTSHDGNNDDCADSAVVVQGLLDLGGAASSSKQELSSQVMDASTNIHNNVISSIEHGGYIDRSEFTRGTNPDLARKVDEGWRDSRIPFPVKLHFLLSEAENDEKLKQIISWHSQGRCFVMRQKEKMSKVLPFWFKQLDFPAFQRNLEMHGFHRLAKGDDKNAFYHQYFLQGFPRVAILINVMPKGSGTRNASSSGKTEQNFSAMSPLSSSVIPSPERVDMLERSNSSVSVIKQTQGDSTSPILLSSSGKLQNCLDPRLDAQVVSEWKKSRIPFPIKLYLMLSAIEGNPELEQIISWQSHGRCFVVHKKEEFLKLVLPCWYKQSDFPNFRRQLDIYGFKRITQGRDMGGYWHEFFLRGMPRLAILIKGTPVKGTGTRKPSSPGTEPDFYKMKQLPRSMSFSDRNHHRPSPSSDATKPALSVKELQKGTTGGSSLDINAISRKVGAGLGHALSQGFPVNLGNGITSPFSPRHQVLYTTLGNKVRSLYGVGFPSQQGNSVLPSRGDKQQPMADVPPHLNHGASFKQSTPTVPRQRLSPKKNNSDRANLMKDEVPTDQNDNAIAPPTHAEPSELGKDTSLYQQNIEVSNNRSSRNTYRCDDESSTKEIRQKTRERAGSSSAKDRHTSRHQLTESSVETTEEYGNGKIYFHDEDSIAEEGSRITYKKQEESSLKESSTGSHQGQHHANEILHTSTHELLEWQRQLEKREEGVAMREKVVATREEGVASREDVVNKREKNVASRENAVTIREKELRSREKSIAAKLAQQGISRSRGSGIDDKYLARRSKEILADAERVSNVAFNTSHRRMISGTNPDTYNVTVAKSREQQSKQQSRSGESVALSRTEVRAKKAQARGSQVDKVITGLAQISNSGMATTDAVDCFFSFIRKNLQVFPCFAATHELDRREARRSSSRVKRSHLEHSIKTQKSTTPPLPNNQEGMRRQQDRTSLSSQEYFLLYNDSKKRFAADLNSNFGKRRHILSSDSAQQLLAASQQQWAPSGQTTQQQLNMLSSQQYYHARSNSRNISDFQR